MFMFKHHLLGTGAHEANGVTVSNWVVSPRSTYSVHVMQRMHMASALLLEQYRVLKEAAWDEVLPTGQGRDNLDALLDFERSHPNMYDMSEQCGYVEERNVGGHGPHKSMLEGY